MSQRVLDEREHRRGLVLGLTLAEVLVLLLFLLLLALGHRLNKLQQDANAAVQERDRLGVELAKLDVKLAQLKLSLPPGLSEAELRALLADLPELRAQKEHLEVQLRTVRPALDSAAHDYPLNPPELLVRGFDLLTREQKESVIRVLRGETQTEVGSGSKEIIPGSTHRHREPSQKDAKGEHNWPPIITLSEARGYFFPSGSAEVSTAFQAKLLTAVISDLMDIIEKYKVDVVEIVGHTDEQKLVVRPSNLDTMLIPFLRGDQPLERFVPSDNAGLGLARAAAVLRVLADDPRLKGVKLLPLSGGHLIEVGDVLSLGKSPGNVKERRRIEVRARRSENASGGWQGNVAIE